MYFCGALICQKGQVSFMSHYGYIFYPFAIIKGVFVEGKSVSQYLYLFKELHTFFETIPFFIKFEQSATTRICFWLCCRHQGFDFGQLSSKCLENRVSPRVFSLSVLIDIVSHTSLFEQFYVREVLSRQSRLSKDKVSLAFC